MARKPTGSLSKKDREAAVRSLSALAVNLSSGWFGLLLIAPNFWPVKGAKEIGLLTLDLFAGIFWWWVSFKLERKLL